MKLLMTKRPNITKVITSRTVSRVAKKDVPCLVYSRPRDRQSKDDSPVVYLPKKTGYQTAYSHLFFCVAGGFEARLHEIYHTCVNDGLNAEVTRRISSYFQFIRSSTSSEKAMIRYINVIIALSLPIFYV